jgi:hypothetical protein
MEFKLCNWFCSVCGCGEDVIIEHDRLKMSYYELKS